MAYKSREELVGKRFISVKSDGKLKLSKILDWEWRSGFVRAVSSRDSSNAKFTVLVEFDDTGWKSREYVKVHEVFQEFLVEHTLVWIGKKDSNSLPELRSALCFKPVVDKAGLFQHSKRPVEFLSDRLIGIVEEKDISFYKEGDENTLLAVRDNPDVVKWIKAWTDYQDGQKILLTTPTVLLGYRVEVYRTEGTTQWYTAVIKSYNHANKSLTLTDDTVLEEHNEDPTLIQMHLIGDGVVDSILNGVDVGVAQRRRPRCTVTKQNSKDSASLITTTRGPISVGTGNSNNSAVCQARTSNNNTCTQPPAFINNKVAKSRQTSLAEASVSGTSAGSEAAEKGQLLSKSSKQTPKRKSDPTLKVAKKLSASKTLKKSASDENLETGSLVCKQTCNVLVKRIEEQSEESSKSQRLRDRSVQNKKNSKSVVIKNSASLEESNSLLNPSETSNAKDCMTESEEKPKDKKRKQTKELENVSHKSKEFKGSLNEVPKESLCHGLKNTPDAHISVNANVKTPINVTTDVLSSSSPALVNVNSLRKEVNHLEEKTSNHELCNQPGLKAQKSKLDEHSTRVYLGGNITGNISNSVEQTDSNFEEDMHYKKQMLRAGGNISSHPSTPTLSVTEGIDRSLTEQLTKRNTKNEKFCLNGDNKLGPEEIYSSTSSLSSQRSESSTTLGKSNELTSDRQSAFTCVQSSLSRSNNATPASEDRADSRASDSQLSGHLSEDKRPGSRLDEIRSVKSSPGSSPLVVDRHEAVHVYRDPELMRKNPVQSNVQNILAQKMNQPFPAGHSSSLPGASATSQSVTAAAFTGVPSLSTRTLLSTIPPYTNPHQLTPSISHHLALPSHGYPMDAVVRVQQHQQQLAVMQQLQMGAYNLGTSSSLEALWQRKLPPTNPIPAQWLQQKPPESLLASELAAALHIQKLEQERREHEQRRELERLERDRERLEQERRDKERREVLERERVEKEKIEREKAERERLEKERIDKERQERERQEWEHNQNQERILRESVDTVAAVDQHFAESLTRLATQQGIGMFPSITRGTGRGFIPKTESHHSLPSHSLPFDKQIERKDKIKREPEPLPDDKRYLTKPSSEKSSVFANYSYNTNFQTSSGITQPNQKPVFNLYGYPLSHSTITTEQLKQRGLVSEPRQIKEETQDKKLFYSSNSPVMSMHSSQSYLPKDIKREAHSSVIVKRDTKPVIKMETPVAAHSHHNSPSSPRPQQPRPAHTPEHRPDRPLSSSTSPATGIHSHLLHHSSPVPSGTQTSLSTSFHSVDTHSSPRSQSPYKPATSQSQPLNFCKSPNTIKKAHEQQLLQTHSNYSAPIAQLPVSMPSSNAYSYSLIQQGLVPNPIYSQGGSSHSSGPPLSQHTPSPLVASLPTNLSQVTKPSQLSPPGCKRKSGSKDSSNANRKKQKGLNDVPGVGQPLSIPVTTPQILTNPSPYTTSSSTSISKPNTALSTALSSSSLPSVNSSSYNDSFKSFVEQTVQIAFLQDEKNTQEKAERERLMASFGSTKQDDRKAEPSVQSVPSVTQAAASALIASRLDLPPASDSYNNRIMETINRVANNQADTDSDTLSASSPPPQSKPDNHSPLNKNVSLSGSSHPHHMKKAWLQRHDEDKKYETPVLSQCEDDSNTSIGHSRDIISCVENSTPHSDQGNESLGATPANVVVTLSNGTVSDLNHNSDESTSSASESEMQNSSKDFGTKKRNQPSKPNSGLAKKSRTESGKESPVSTPPPSSSNSSNSSRKKNSTNKRNKLEKDKLKDEQGYSSAKQSRDNSPVPPKQDKNKMSSLPMVSTPSPHSPERSNPSPALSESNTANMSPASSTSSNSSNTATSSKSGSKNLNKDKKKTRRNQESSSKDSKKSSSFNKPLVKMTVANLKRTMIPFIQDGPCSEITPKLTKCRECKMTPVQRSKKQPNIFCRFYAFRRLKYNPRGLVTIHGFSELSDADPDDIEPWLPRFPIEEPELDVENSKFIIAKVGDKFCELVEQEKEAKSWARDDVKIVWKRAVMGVREMCDVCDTTLFNMHWVCQKCGFVVCLDCYKVRIKEGKKALIDDKWLTCSANRQAHKASEMMLTQIIPSDALWELGRLIHDIRTKWSIPSNCPCGGGNSENKLVPKNGINQQLLNAVNTRKLPNGYGSEEHGNKHSNKSKKPQENIPLKNLDSYNPDTTSSPLSILAEIATMEPESKLDAKRKLEKTSVQDESLEETDKKSGCSTLRELLTKTAGKPKVTNDKKGKKGSGLSTLDDIIQSVVEKSCTDGGSAPFKFLHYTPRLGGWKREVPIMVHNLTETSVLYPDVPHSWLCDGRLLRLHDAHHKGNLQIFQEQWKRGQPVLVSCANKKMNINLWKPEVFSKEFGHLENEVVNCRTGNTIIGHTMGDFWDGFENLTNRPVDENDDPMLLKLKDWPPGDDFSELLPSRFQDLMQALPLPEYTQRNGKLNLASRLPDFLVRPDLGPKMYNAYGSSQFPKEGTTNLHLDISDAVNVMVYVGIPWDGPGGRKAQEEAAVKAIDDAGCDSITKRRVREVHEIPGALWHIYDAHDADKIRDFLNKVAKERGEIIEKDHDAIHDQSWYLDKELCDRLLKEYGVQGYTIVQCLGDALFIPAGAPHQVRNLHSCVKVAEDFVSPEHLNHCFRLTQEFRQLSETHSNHEDKLQVKNIIYHAVKDAIAVLREHNPEDE
ncbi:lysine-specific demethylase 3B isoform X1 [Biomphalaria glabrata]|nr:lysine-specific demethylase 3B isoform X1 [Biomphalaria glabrata]